MSTPMELLQGIKKKFIETLKIDPYIAKSGSFSGKFSIGLGSIDEDRKQSILQFLRDNDIPYVDHPKVKDTILIDEEKLQLLSSKLQEAVERKIATEALLQGIKKKFIETLKIDPYIAKSGSFSGKFSIGLGSIDEGRKQSVLQFLQGNGIPYVDHPKSKDSILIDEKKLQLLSSRLQEAVDANELEKRLLLADKFKSLTLSIGSELGSGGGLWKPKPKEDAEKSEEPGSPGSKPKV